MEKPGLAFMGLLLVLLFLAISFLLVGGIVYICSLAFHFEFSWMLVLGICGIAVLLKWIFK